ncbi:hypothetical protein [Pseudomonas guariconensis]|uniref:hypothetical protein n=1 Tax=Pseudomonas guariconensis TaxID=1288410 RepID=UPI0018D7DE64|nr:hypothetical protein [Pseudomonas guariconensis]MBH3358810.1 hypothetical protein [Pseudomonas guariconensis]
MTINLTKLKALAEAAKRDPYDHLAANDYGMSMPPATALELIAEIERHRLVEAEGCKPEISNRPVGGHTSDAPPMRDLDKAEGCKPDLINAPFFYALAGPDGKPHYDDFCVANNPADLKCHEEGITIVPLYRHPAPTVQQGVPIGYMNQPSIDAVQHDGQALIMVGVNGFPPGDQAIPVYTHADPGEVEHWKSTAEHFSGVSIKAAEEVSRLRAKLTELESSVREFVRIDGLSVDGSAARNKALKMLAATLSPSAELELKP